VLLRAKDPPALHDDHPGGWGRSRQSSKPRLAAWLFAVAVVAVLTIALHILYY
jgi:hypothetical protein